MLLTNPFHSRDLSHSSLIQEEEISLLRNMISNHFGIHFDDHKTWLLNSKIFTVMASRGYTSFMDYYQQLVRLFYVGHSFDHPEWEALVNTLANHETYFFREHNAMEEAVRLVSGILASRPAPVRILSAGCSTGEEAYSLAASLMEAGHAQFEIVGIDLDRAVISHAWEGRYQNKSFRAMNDYLDERYGAYFIQDGRTRRLALSVQNRVQFIPANLMDVADLEKLGQFDIIFCRNVVIYFDRDGQDRAVANLRRSLVDRGYLFLGHSESLIDRDAGFQVCRNDEVVYYRKK